MRSLWRLYNKGFDFSLLLFALHLSVIKKNSKCGYLFTNKMKRGIKLEQRGAPPVLPELFSDTRTTLSPGMTLDPQVAPKEFAAATEAMRQLSAETIYWTHSKTSLNELFRHLNM